MQAEQPIGSEHSSCLSGFLLRRSAHAGTYGDLAYSSNGSSILITYCATSATNVVIPAILEGLPVTDIGSRSFFNCSSLTNVSIGYGVTNIGDNAFNGCSKLAHVSIPGSVIYMGNSIFARCYSIADIAIPDSVTSMGGGAFYQCTSLTNVSIGSGVTNIGNLAFQFCTSLDMISVDPINPSYSDSDGILFSKNQTRLVHCPAARIGSYAVPATVTNLANGAFYATSLSAVFIPENVGAIGDWAFQYGTNLADIAVDPANPAYIGLDGVLFDKGQTTLIQYPAGKTSASYTFPDGVTRIGNGAFTKSYNLVGIEIPNTVTNIGRFAFQESGIESITISDNVANIEDYAFHNCTNLARIYFTGNAPTGFYGVFSGIFATVYYLPGTSGWYAWYDGLPTKLWNPGMQFGEGYGPTTNGFSFNISGTADIPIAVVACTNLSEGNWITLQTTNLVSGSLDFTDADWTDHPTRIYRIAAP